MVISAQSSNSTTVNVLPGQSFPLGATVSGEGVNFCLFSRDCTAIDLLLFDQPDAPQPSQVISLDPKFNKTNNYWHVFVPGSRSRTGLCLSGIWSFEPERGLRCDGEKVLLDPFARAIVNWQNYSRTAARLPGDNCAKALREWL